MTNSVGRIYAIALAVVVFFILWATIAANPFGQSNKVSATSDPKLLALQARQTAVQNQAIKASQTLNKRWATYRAALIQQKGSLTASQKAILKSAPAGPSVIVKVTNAKSITTTTSSGVVIHTTVPVGTVNPNTQIQSNLTQSPVRGQGNQGG